MVRTVVFAYHDVGVRCLSVLLAHGVDVALVVTHEDDPRENVFFHSVAELARRHELPVLIAESVDQADLLGHIARLAPDFIFSFYFRRMLPPAMLDLAHRGAFNMHGSLLPKYRGRAPVNWAILHGERETGATLHQMVAKPDAGAIVDQQAVPILPDDIAIEVFNKVTVAAEMVLDRALPGLLDGTARLRPQDLAQGSYFGVRKPGDGRIDWSRPAAAIHNLVRAVAPPYPGAFCSTSAGTLRILRTMHAPGRRPMSARPGLYCADSACFADCADGKVLRVLAMEHDGQPLGPDEFRARFGDGKLFTS
ncbi:MAG: formyltransferase [Pseudomonadota bacterium]|jgi:methionyl-tRNA formyltransferase